MDKAYFGYQCYLLLTSGTRRRVNFQLNELLGQIFAITLKYYPGKLENVEEVTKTAIIDFQSEWQRFMTTLQTDGKLVIFVRDPVTGQTKKAFSKGRWLRNRQVQAFMVDYFGPQPVPDNPN